jgi:hypothetical protein
MAIGFSKPGRNRRIIVTFRQGKSKQFRCKDLQPAERQNRQPKFQGVSEKRWT